MKKDQTKARINAERELSEIIYRYLIHAVTMWSPEPTIQKRGEPMSHYDRKIKTIT